jgi:ATP-dependent DNA helicase RecG
VEAWGRGFDKIRAGCEEYGGELPAYEISENGIMVLCRACPSYLEMLENEVDKVHGSEGNVRENVRGSADLKVTVESLAYWRIILT